MIEQPITQPITQPPLARLASDIVKRVLRAMACTADDTTLKQCIMTAREHGHLTDEECGWFITFWGPRGA